jgi:hypothetical protein
VNTPSARWSVPEIVVVAGPCVLGACAMAEGHFQYGFGLLMCAVLLTTQTQLVKALLREVAS